jgi:hypothetical protein
MRTLGEFLKEQVIKPKEISRNIAWAIEWKRRERLNKRARFLAVTATQIALSLGATEQPIGIVDPNDHVLVTGDFPLPDGITISVGSNVDDSDAANRKIECSIWTHREEETLESCRFSSAGPGYCSISYNDGVSEYDQWNNKTARKGAGNMIDKLISAGAPIHPI